MQQAHDAEAQPRDTHTRPAPRHGHGDERASRTRTWRHRMTRSAPTPPAAQRTSPHRTARARPPRPRCSRRRPTRPAPPSCDRAHVVMPRAHPPACPATIGYDPRRRPSPTEAPTPTRRSQRRLVDGARPRSRITQSPMPRRHRPHTRCRDARPARHPPTRPPRPSISSHVRPVDQHAPIQAGADQMLPETGTTDVAHQPAADAHRCRGRVPPTMPRL